MFKKFEIIKKFRVFFKKFEIKNIYNSYPIIFLSDINLKSYGFIIKLDIEGFCGFLELEQKKDFLIALFNAKDIFFNRDILEVVINPVLNLDYSYIPLENTQLLLGYDFRGDSIVSDMSISPHLLITGLSGQGKTGMLRVIIQNLENADIVLCNCFEDDFENVKCKKLIGEKNIYNFLLVLLLDPVKREVPLYIFLEELSLLKSKELVKIIKELLCVARHYNIFIVGVIQISTKEDLSFKSYFNSRLTFSQVDSSSYQVILGTSVNGKLKKQEFYFIDETLKKAKTYFLP